MRPMAGIILAVASVTAQAPAGLVDTFPIALKQQVSNGVPGRGAGNIEVAGAQDIYELAIAGPTAVYFDEVSGPCTIVWSCAGPNGAVFATNPICVGDPGSVLLPAAGTYTITVQGNAGGTGTYSFIVYEVDPVETFPIAVDQTVAPGAPAPGAGVLEEPGAADQYLLAIDAPATVYFNELSGSCALRWSCVGPDAQPVFEDVAICVTDPGAFELASPGTYTITVWSPTGAVGNYSFGLVSVEPPQVFPLAIDEAVTDGVPFPGAGNIEEPGAVDEYLLTIDAPTTVYLDESALSCGLYWTCTGPSGEIVFEPNPMCVTDPGTRTLAPGTYTIRCYGLESSVGTYGIQVWSVEPPQVFAIGLGDTVSRGVPARGAGFLEEPGSVDIYHLAVPFPSTVYFDELAGSCGIWWSLTDPGGRTLFPAQPICSTDPGSLSLVAAGTYEITVSAPTGLTGSYSFQAFIVEPPQTFTIAIGDTVSNGVPSRGAGHIETPASVDLYHWTGDVGDIVCFDEGSGSCGVAWQATAPSGDTLFIDPAICSGTPGTFTLTEGGEHTIVVYGVNGGSGTYSFTLAPGREADVNGDCSVNAADLAILLGEWGPCGDRCLSDLDGDGLVSATDLGILLGDWD